MALGSLTVSECEVHFSYTGSNQSATIVWC